MEKLTSLACARCGDICVVLNGLQIYHYGDELVCDACGSAIPGLFPLNTQERESLKNEGIMAMCHTNQGAYFALKPSYYLLCYLCQQYRGDRECLNMSNPRNTLRKALIRICKETDDEFLFRRWRKSLRDEQRVTNIHSCLVESYFLQSPVPICIIHHYKATYYEIVNFQFLCAQCPTSEYSCLYADPQHYQHILATCFETLKGLPTAAFNAYLIKAIQTKTWDKNFLFFMKEAVENRMCPLNDLSLCLMCGKQFGYELAQPMQLHETQKHEVCLECFLNYPVDICLVDGEPIVKRLIPVEKFEIDKKFKKCRDQPSHLFCIKNNKLPFRVCCASNICEQCIEPAEGTQNLVCIECKDNVKLENVTLNHSLVNDIAYSELICPVHNELISIYHKYADFCCCKRCPDVIKLKKSKNFHEDPKRFRGILLDLIKKYINAKQYLFLASSIFQLQAFYSLEKIYDLSQDLRKYFPDLIVDPILEPDPEFPIVIEEVPEKEYQQESQYEVFMRFTKILPINFGQYLRWAILPDYKETIKISTNGLLELHGLIIGNSDGEPVSVSILNQGTLMANGKLPSKADRQQSSVLLFPFPILISKLEQKLEIIFTGPGKFLCHGMPRSQPSPLVYKNCEIFIDSDSFENGNNIIGGPIHGFCFSKTHLTAEEAKIFYLCQQKGLIRI